MAYDSVDDAAAAALAYIAKQKGAASKEYIGLIYQDPDTGKYLFTEPSTQSGRKSRDGAKGTFSVPKGSARAIVHNHPTKGKSAGSRDHLFSPDDIAMSSQLGLPSFIGVGDEIKRWDPQNPSRQSRGGGVGTPVVAQIAMDQLPKRRGEPDAYAGLMR